MGAPVPIEDTHAALSQRSLSKIHMQHSLNDHSKIHMQQSLNDHSNIHTCRQSLNDHSLIYIYIYREREMQHFLITDASTPVEIRHSATLNNYCYLTKCMFIGKGQSCRPCVRSVHALTIRASAASMSLLQRAAQMRPCNFAISSSLPVALA